MDAQIILSILTPSIPERWRAVVDLQRIIAEQTGDLPVEHLVLCDNRKRSIGRKRDGLLRLARGKYVAFVDDDDGVSDDYVGDILAAATSDPDVITFQQRALVGSDSGIVELKLGNPNEAFAPGAITKRNAWHICAWRASLAIGSGFPDVSYGEDWAYAAPLCAVPNLKEAHIPRVLHFYTYDPSVSRATP